MFDILFEYTKSEEKLQYAGDCRTILDDGNFDNVAVDATELAQLVENGEQITFERFIDLTTIDPTMVEQEFQKQTQRYSFWYNSEKNIAWYRDGNKDIEYFYW